MEAPDELTGDEGDVGDPEPITPADDDSGLIGSGQLVIGSYARVCNATALNQREAPSTYSSVLKLLPAGSTVKILASSAGWYQNDWNGSIGWSSGYYLCADDGSDGGGPGGTTPEDANGEGFASTEISRASFLSIGRAAVGFSYWWGGARFVAGGNPGTCSGSCPSCSHSGSYGADCSGFIAKAWLLPQALPMGSNSHPYSTSSFAGTSSLWSSVSRSSLQAGDALVYRASGAGHIVMYDRNDPWSQFWAYEARGCSYGIVHNIRTAGSAYRGIRRTGV